MDASHIAILRMKSQDGLRAIAGACAAALERLQGVSSVELDIAGGCLVVWFSRARVNLADLVRAVEDAGGRVSGVAQSRAGVGAEIAATA